MTTTTVRYLDSTMTGAPVISGVAGTLATAIDTLIAGFNSQTAASVVVSGGIATFNKTAHGFAMIGNTGTGLVQVGPVVTIAGATPSGLNGDKRILSVPNADSFTYDATGISNQTATGTITAKYAGVPLTVSHTASNKRILQHNGAGGTGLYFRIDDSDARYPAVRGAEGVVTIDVLTSEIPRIATIVSYTGLIKSSTADSTARPWRIISDGYFTYFINAWVASNARNGIYWFGDIISFVSADAYHFGVCGHENATPSSMAVNKAGSLSIDGSSSSGQYLARAAAQTGSPVDHKLSGSRFSTGWGVGGAVFPGSISTNLFFHYPVVVQVSATVEPRGKLPGAMQPIQDLTTAVTDKDIHLTDHGSAMLCCTTTTGSTNNAWYAIILDQDWRPA